MLDMDVRPVLEILESWMNQLHLPFPKMVILDLFWAVRLSLAVRKATALTRLTVSCLTFQGPP